MSAFPPDLPMELMSKPDGPIDHLVPGITIAQDGLVIQTTSDMTVRITVAPSEHSQGGEIELTQREFSRLLSWSEHLLHRDYG